MRGKKGYLVRRGRCLAGLTASLVVLRWRPVALSWLTDGDSQRLCNCFKRRRERFFLFLSPLVFFSFFFLFFLCFVYQWLSPLSSRFVSKNSLPGFKLPVFFPSSLYISFPLFLFSLSSLPFGSFFLSLRFVLSSSFSSFCVLALSLYL